MREKSSLSQGEITLLFGKRTVREGYCSCKAKFRDALEESDCFADIPAEVWEKEWVVHSKPVGDGTKALEYLAPYIFRVAISPVVRPQD